MRYYRQFGDPSLWVQTLGWWLGISSKQRVIRYEFRYKINRQTRMDSWQKQLKDILENRLSVGEEEEVVDCPRCGFQMKHMQACHMVCTNCGGHMDCSEKGLTW